MSTPTARLQAGFVAPAAATIRFTDDPTGSPTSSTFAVAQGDSWRSADAFLAAWTAQIVADLGAGFSIEAGPDGHRSQVTVTTSGSNFSVAWSHSGDGSAIYDWLGETGDLTNEASGYQFDAAVTASFIPDHPLQSLARQSTARHAHGFLGLTGATQGQHGTSVGDVDRVLLDVGLRWGSPGDYSGHSAFEAFLSDIYSGNGVQPRFSLLYGSDEWVCLLPGGELELFPVRTPGTARGASWDLGITVIAEVTPW